MCEKDVFLNRHKFTRHSRAVQNSFAQTLLAKACLADTVIVVLEQEQVIAVSPLARRAGVRPGMRRADSIYAALELFDRVGSMPTLLFGVRHLLQQVMAWLFVRQLAVERIELQLINEHGRVAKAPAVLKLALGEAVWRDELLLDFYANGCCS